jgi:hypothetical protein
MAAVVWPLKVSVKVPPVTAALKAICWLAVEPAFRRPPRSSCVPMVWGEVVPVRSRMPELLTKTFWPFSWLKLVVTLTRSLPLKSPTTSGPARAATFAV